MNFSMLRSSLGGLYAWRAQNSRNPDEKERMLNEADFAFRQAFALCPTSPEVVFRYINLLAGEKRLDDAILITELAMKLEQEPRSPDLPNRLTQLSSLLGQLKKMRK